MPITAGCVRCSQGKDVRFPTLPTTNRQIDGLRRKQCCPPTDPWLGELSQRFSAEGLVVLFLDVDYRNYVGRQDPQFGEVLQAVAMPGCA